MRHCMNQSAMQKYKIVISYNGTSFNGWQVQANGLSIQTIIQRALAMLLRQPVDLTGSGRTDAGVHALGQTAHFTAAEKIDQERLLYSLNALLPPEIRILSLEPVDDSFHARYSAKGKIYHYRLHLHKVPDPFTRLYTTYFPFPSSLSLLQEAATAFIGTKDFTSFANEPHSGSAAKDAVRTLKRLDVAEEKGGIRLEFEADGFLYKMVRNITGTLLDIATKKLPADSVAAILEARDRRKAGRCAPAQGLCLIQVLY